MIFHVLKYKIYFLEKMSSFSLTDVSYESGKWHTTSEFTDEHSIKIHGHCPIDFFFH